MTLTHARLIELLHYNPETGIFTWRQTRSHNAVAGNVAGYLRPDGRRVINLQKKNYLLSRLAWFYVYGRWPMPDVDHINRNRGDDRLMNLREATRTQNVANRAKFRGVSRFIGVSRKRNKWEARIQCHGVGQRLGCYSSEEEAAKVYDIAARKLFGDFAQLNFPN